ncbi:MAG: hypothetical protein ABWY12_02910 [Burkholderiales bacterium]
MLRPDRLLAVVEVHEVTKVDVDRAKSEPHLLCVDQVKVDELLEGAAQPAHVVERSGALGAGSLQEWGRQPRLEKSRNAREYGELRAEQV